MSSIAPSRTSARSSPTGSGAAASSSLTPLALPLGLSAGAKAGIALGAIIALLLFLILLVLFFFRYRRKQHHSKRSPGIAGDELQHAGTDAEKTAPSVPPRAALREDARPSGLATGKEYGALIQHEQSRISNLGVPVEQPVVAEGHVLKLEEPADARSSLFEPSRTVDESSLVAGLEPSNVSIAAPLPQTKEQCLTYVEDFITDNIHQFFNPEEVVTRTEKAVLQADIISKKYGLRPEVTPGVMKLAFYDFVVLCDDSSSMTSDPQCIPTLKDTLRRVAEFATILEPMGISVRFLNHHEDFNGLVDAKEVEEKVSKVPFFGTTRLGEVLDYKIVQPMIIQKVRERRLKKPVLVVIITDGQPCGEAPDRLRKTIQDCKKPLDLEGFGDTAAIFLLSRVGDDEEAKTFLKGLENDKEIGDMVFCSTENIVTRLAAYPHSSDARYTAWLIELFVAALGKQTEQQQKRKQGVRAT